jgi:hypothetical protein
MIKIALLAFGLALGASAALAEPAPMVAVPPLDVWQGGKWVETEGPPRPIPVQMRLCPRGEHWYAERRRCVPNSWWERHVRPFLGRPGWRPPVFAPAPARPPVHRPPVGTPPKQKPQPFVQQ